MDEASKSKPILDRLLTDPRLIYDERRSIAWAISRIRELESEKTWRNPYTEAIGVLEARARVPSRGVLVDGHGN